MEKKIEAIPVVRWRTAYDHSKQYAIIILEREAGAQITVALQIDDAEELADDLANLRRDSTEQWH